MEVLKPERKEPDSEQAVPVGEIEDLISRVLEYRLAVKNLREQIAEYEVQRKTLVKLVSAGIPQVDVPSSELRDYVFDMYWGHEQVVTSSALRLLVSNRLPLVKFADVVTGLISVVCPTCEETYQVSVGSRTQVTEKKKERNCVCEACKNEALTPWKAGRKLAEDQRDQEIARLKSLPYAEYLQTEHWMSIRATALQRARYKCQVCNSKDSLHVHHRTYDNLGREQPSDLTVLCKSCHEKAHNIKES